MSASPKTLRSPPPRIFEDYVLSHVTSQNINLTKISNKALLPCGAAGAGYADDSKSDPIDIGFSFEFDGITYNRFVASANGWIVLVDPSLGTFTTSEIFDSSEFVNSAIKSTFSSNAVLLAPWFDDLRNIASDPTQVSGFGALKIERIRQGLEPVPITVNETQNAVKFYRDTRSTQGRRLIVRWFSLSDYAAASTIIKFEAVIYENGTIEFRYVPRSALTLTSSANEDATIGIFMPNGTNRFRDMSFGLGYRDSERQRYKWGGAVYTSTYIDTADSFSAYYTCNLKPSIHWPGQTSMGSALVFSPPALKRRILPRRELRDNDSRLTLPTVSRMGGNITMFDDRRSAVFSNVLSGSGIPVSFPSTLPHFFGDHEPGMIDRLNLFSSGSLELTASINKFAIEQFIGDQSKQFIAPFSERALFENDPTSNEQEFFLTGTNINEVGDGLQQPLRSKTQVKLSFAIDNSCTLLTASSNIYYFNKRTNSWNTPISSSYVVANGATGLPGRTKYVVDPLVDLSERRIIIEDAIGFGPIGNTISSGTVDRAAFSFNQSDLSIGNFFVMNSSSYTDAINKSYPKSVQNNAEFEATPDETFVLPISQPFLIEKAVIEIPMAAGAGWFNDKTTCFQPIEESEAIERIYETKGFDFAGPALTVALFNQIKFGDGTTQRDLIMSGTITHSNDNVSELVLSNFPPIHTTYQLRPRGFLAFAKPSVVVSQTALNTFTGSVAIPCTAMISNGVIVRFQRLINNIAAADNILQARNLFNAKTLVLATDLETSTPFDQTARVAYVNPYGRGGSGFDPSGRSVFGKEFAASQILNAKGTINNPFYLETGSIINTQIGVAIDNIGSDHINAMAAIPLESHRPSPYLVFPGDKLILAVSKTRPFCYGGYDNPAGRELLTSSSITHDVQLITGSMYITLYGSLLKENKEFHDTLKQPLSSDAIHEIVVGNEPVLDQFEVPYRNEYIGTTYDNYVTGSLLILSQTLSGKKIFVTGSRANLFSKVNARNAGYPNTDSKAFNFQPWFERAGMVRASVHIDESERAWDSMMPSIQDIMIADGKNIWIPANDSTTKLTLFDGSGAYVTQTSVGWIFLNYAEPGISALSNVNWQMSYPFEPRYSGLARQVTQQRNFTVKRMFSFVGPTVTAISRVKVNGLMIITPEPAAANNSPIRRLDDTLAPNLFIASDVVLGRTGSMNNDDLSRYLFGFGDNNTICAYQGGNGANNFPVMRSSGSRGGNQVPLTHYTQSPIIRGWKYGVMSGLPFFNRSYFRQKSFGQVRDMLEQRLYTKTYQSFQKGKHLSTTYKQSVGSAVVNVKFVDYKGNITPPENTWSQNLSSECTSSVPYFDGETRNRPETDVGSLNSSIFTISP